MSSPPNSLTYIVTLSLEKPTSTVIVLALLDDRYYRAINGRSNWSFDFVLFRRGESEPLAESGSPRPLARSGNLEIELGAGEYIIHVSDSCAVPVNLFSFIMAGPVGP